MNKDNSENDKQSIHKDKLPLEELLSQNTQNEAIEKAKQEKAKAEKNKQAKAQEKPKAKPAKNSANKAKANNKNKANKTKEEPKPKANKASKDDKSIIVARSNQEYQEDQKSESLKHEAKTDNPANYINAHSEHDPYVESKFKEARDRQERSKSKYPPAEFLRSTPPMEASAKLVKGSADKSSNYVPYYDSYPSLKAEQDSSTSEEDNYNYDENIASSANEEEAGKARAEKASSKAYSKKPLATRSSSATRAAGLDLSEHFINSELSKSLSLARKKHPYLMERPLYITDEDALGLIRKVKAVPNYRVTELANKLSSEEVKFIFHAILILDPADKNTYHALQQIAVTRASWSLYTIGWSSLQRYFPNRRIQRALELVYESLMADPDRAHVRPSYLTRAIGDIISFSKSDSAFVNDIVRNLNQSYNLSPEEGLETFIYEYLLLVKSNLGGACFGEFFRKADLSVLFEKADILTQALAYMHPGVASEIISRVIASRENIEGPKLYIYKKVADLFLHTNNQAMWQYMSKNLIRNYKSWYIAEKIEDQTAIYPAKHEFINTYSADIEDLAMLSPDIMALRFPGFIIFDDRKNGDSLMYYDDLTIKELLKRGLEEKDLAQTELATKDAKKALDEYALQGPTLLSVKAQDLEYSRRFMDKLLRRSNTRQKRIFDSWFKNKD